MVQHDRTLSEYGIDPLDPSARQPVSFDVSLATYGSYWQYASRFGMSLVYILDRSAYDYKVFSGNAPDVFGAYTDFGFQTYYVWLVAQGNVDIDYTANNINSMMVIQGLRQHILPLSVNGFRIKNSVAGTNTPYQLVIWR